MHIPHLTNNKHFEALYLSSGCKFCRCDEHKNEQLLEHSLQSRNQEGTQIIY